MRRRLRRLLIGVTVHCLLSLFALAGIRVWQSGYNRTHADQLQAASLRITGSTAELSLLTGTMTLPLPEDSGALRTAAYFLSDDAVRGWLWLFDTVTDVS